MTQKRSLSHQVRIPSAGSSGVRRGRCSPVDDHPAIGLKLPGISCAKPDFVGALDWLLCDGLRSVADTQRGESLYLRLTTRPLDQAPFEWARARLGAERLRAHVLAGAYLLHDASEAAAAGAPVVNLFASGAVMPEALAAAGRLAGEGVAAHVVDVTSLDRLYRGWREALQRAIRTATRQRGGGHLEQVIPHDARSAPIVTIHDAATHAMAWLGSVFGSPVVPLGVDSFGQSGRIEDLYGAHDLLPGAIVNATLLALDRS